jgi:hypothetical protein
MQETAKCVERAVAASTVPSNPRLSGSAGVPLERHLSGVGEDRGFAVEQAIERSAMHQVDPDQAGEGERAGDGLLPGLGQWQQQKDDQRDGDLDAHGIFAGAEEAADLEGLLDPAEEQLDGPAALVKIGDLLGRSIEVVAEDAQHLAGIEPDRTSRTRSWNGLSRPLPPVRARGRLWRAGRWPMRSDRIGPSAGTGNCSTTAKGVLDLSRVTIRHCAASSLAHHA